MHQSQQACYGPGLRWETFQYHVQYFLLVEESNSVATVVPLLTARNKVLGVA